jgi:tRNA A-37 threonylcarbamoyl transferase component Bud32/outer membrane protein assembly factor BamB
MANVLVGGRYRLLARIGAGGMGVVWSGRDEVLRRRVAVKELRHGWGSSDRTIADGRERSLREARAAAALDHPNIVAVYDIVEHGDRPWIVMELVVGRSLRDVVVEDGPLPVDRAVEIGVKLLSALQSAHAAGITHRDVKPANVLISDTGEVRLTDFGLATLPDTETLTETGVVLGTLGYLAPEQAKGSTPGPPADVFGLAATVYYAIEGVGPFHRDGYLPMLVAYTRHDIRAPQRAGALTPALMRLLAADPGKRPTAEQARELLAGGTVRRSRVSRRMILAGAAAGTAAVAVGGIGLRSDRWRALVGDPRQVAGGGRLSASLWRREDLRDPILVGSTLVGLHPDGLLAVDVRTGEERWRRGPAGGWTLKGAVDEALVLVQRPASYEVLDAGTGAVRSQGVAATDSVVAWTSGMVIQKVLGTSSLMAYDAFTSRQRWQTDGPLPSDSEYCGITAELICSAASIPPIRNSRPPLTAQEKSRFDKTILVGSYLQTGRDVWKRPIGPDGVLRGLWGFGDRFYALTAEKGQWKLLAVYARTGARAWTIPIAQGSPAQPPVTSNSTEPTIDLFAVGASARLVVARIQQAGPNTTEQTAALIAVDTATGTVRWRHPDTPFRTLVNHAGKNSGDRFVALDTESPALYQIDPATGRVRWIAALPAIANQLHIHENLALTVTPDDTTGYRLL